MAKTKRANKTLRELREDKKMTLDQVVALAREQGAKLDVSALSRVERGYRSLPDAWAPILSDIYGVKLFVEVAS